MFLFYPIIIGLGICSSYTDIKFRKIRNNHLILATIFGLIIYTYLILNNKILLNINIVINFFIGLSLGFLLYFTDAWGAGDAKLFAVFCLLMPTKKYSEILPFSSVIVFINIFLLSTLFILALSIGQTIKNKHLILKKIFSFKTLGELTNSFIIVFALGWLILPLTKPLRAYLTLFVYILILYFSYLFIFGLISKLKKNYLIFLILGLGLISRLIFKPSDFAFSELLSYLKMTLFYALAFYILHIVFDLNKDEEKNEKLIPFAPLMFLGTLTANTDSIYWMMHTLNILRK